MTEHIEEALIRLKKIEYEYFNTDNRTFKLDFQTAKALRVVIEHIEIEDRKKNNNTKDRQETNNAIVDKNEIEKKTISQEIHDSAYLISRCAQALYLINGTLNRKLEKHEQKKNNRKVILKTIAGLIIGTLLLVCGSLIMWRV